MLSCTAAAWAKSPTLAKVKAAGVLQCGINIEQAEYSTSDSHGTREAFDEDLCRAVGVAILGEGAHVVMKHYPDDRTVMAALTTGEVDVVASLTDDLSHAAGTGIGFTRPVLWDGVGFLVLGAQPALRARQLSGKKICFLAETDVEDGLRAWFAQEHLQFVAFPFQEEGEMDAAFTTNNCGALAEDRTRLVQTQSAMKLHDRRSTLLPETISKDPLAAAFRNNDAQWGEVVNWVIEALVQAEESGVTQANVKVKRTSTDPVLRQLLGGSLQIGHALGLDEDWVVRIIDTVGNYGEIYDRDLGAGSNMRLPRGANALWNHGGVMIALPPK